MTSLLTWFWGNPPQKARSRAREPREPREPIELREPRYTDDIYDDERDEDSLQMQRSTDPYPTDP